MAAWRPSWFFYQHDFQLGPTRHQGDSMCEVSELCDQWSWRICGHNIMFNRRTDGVTDAG